MKKFIASICVVAVAFALVLAASPASATSKFCYLDPETDTFICIVP